MIQAIELWVQRADGRQSVIRIADDVTIRDLPDVPFGPQDQPPDAPGATLTGAQRDGLLDLLHEVQDDIDAFQTRGQAKQADYATAMAGRIAALLGGAK